MTDWILYIIMTITAIYLIYKGWSIIKSVVVLVIVWLVSAIGLYFIIPSYDKDGYEFVLNHLDSPTTATLLKSIPKGEFTDMIKDNTTFKIPDNLEFEYYKIEATNVFGGRIAKDFVVFFWKGSPIYMEEDGGECFSSPQNWMATKLAIKYNTGIDIDQ